MITKTTPFIHPELMQGEVFFSNMNLSDFSRFHFSTKRKGFFSYDGEGRKLLHRNWFPVFVKKAELDKARNSLQELRRTFNQH